MAKLSSDHKYVTVERGDTLSAIARDYKSYSNNATYQQLAAINNISNPNKIYVGQKIYLTKNTTTTTTKKASTKKATITHFGLQSDSDNLIFATWKWDQKNTDHYEYQWYYATGDGVAFVGSKSTTTDKQSTYTFPSNATKVKFRVKPISKTYTKNKKETKYWTAEWTDWKYFYAKDIPPDTPAVPTVNIEKYKLTASLDGIASEVKKIEFYVVKNDTKKFKTSVIDVKTAHASMSCTVDAGGEYKVRCRAIKGELKSEWSNYSENVGTMPSAIKEIKSLKATSETVVAIDWDSVKNSTYYDIEYTTEKRFFDSSNEVQSMQIDAKAATNAQVTGLESGKKYFFRVRARNDMGASAWTEIKSIIVGSKPGAPTTWSSTTTAKVGDPLKLYWVHNTEDGSSQTLAQVKMVIGGQPTTHTIDTTKNYESGGLKYTAPKSLEDGEVVTSVCSFNTSGYAEGTKIQWSVRTAGITEKYGDWSTTRTIDIYAPPSLSLDVTLKNGNSTDIINAFPFYISAEAGPTSQKPIGYHINITSEETYETVNYLGETKVVKKGESVYSKYFDINTSLLAEMSAHNIDLENGVTYKATCTVTMNSGLNAEDSATFDVSWDEPDYEPNAEISINDEKSVSVNITPYCENALISYHRVLQNEQGGFYETTELLDTSIYGTMMTNIVTNTSKEVFQGVTADGEEVYYCEHRQSVQINNVTLSVYRREFDGSFTEIATGLTNNTTVVDLHPALDYARYRIVAIDNNTGGVSYYDMPSYPIGETAVIIQWDEDSTDFHASIANEDEFEEPTWVGSMLRLPYNIDVSDKTKPDVELIEYIGRKHPVSYYGTHQGVTATWNVVIRKDDEETLYGLRRLACWMGDVYVREPSGSGYWANITVSFSQKHNDLTIPVTLDIARVEGGM